MRRIQTIGATAAVIVLASAGIAAALDSGRSSSATDDNNPVAAAVFGSTSTSTSSTSSTSTPSSSTSTSTTIGGSDDGKGSGSSGKDGRTETFFGLALGVQTVSVSGYGSITVNVTASGLAFVSATGVDGWTATLDEVEANEVKVDFRKGGTTVEAKVEIEDGALRLRVEIEDSDDGDSDDDDSDDGDSDDGDSDDGDNSGSDSGSDDGRTETFFGLALGVQTVSVSGYGSITVNVTASGLAFVSATGVDGWTATLDEVEANEVKVDFRKGGTTVEAKVEIEDGALRLRVELD